MKFKVGFFPILTPVLVVIIPTLAAAVIIVIFSFQSTPSINADAHSFVMPSSFVSSSSSLQSQQTGRQQGSTESNEIGIIRNPNLQGLTHGPVLISLQSSSVKSSMSQQIQLQQQQQNQTPNQQYQDTFRTNGITNSSNNPDDHVSRPITLLPFVTKFPEPECHFTKDPLFCPHNLWTLK